MARRSGDITLSTFRRILSCMIENGHSQEDATEFLYGIHDAEDGETFKALVEECDAMDLAKSGYVPGKPGRKSEVNEAAIAVEVLKSFVIGGEPMTVDRFPSMPDGMKVALCKRIAEAVKAARASVRAAKQKAEILELAKAFNRGEASLSTTKCD